MPKIIKAFFSTIIQKSGQVDKWTSGQIINRNMREDNNIIKKDSYAYIIIYIRTL